MDHGPVSDDVAMQKLRAVLAAHDIENVLWPPENVTFATSILRRARSYVPSIDDVANEIGEERAQAMLPAIIKSRKFENFALGYNAPCHYCSSREELVRFDFALMNVVHESRKWGETAASVALSAISLPTLGAGMVRLPGKSFQGPAIHLRLVVCKPCRKKNGNVFGSFVLNEQRASKHPLWDQLFAAGFTKFLVRETLPDDFKYRANMRL